MGEKKFEERTKAQWLALSDQKGGSRLGVPSPEKIHEALLWFAAEESNARHQTEERRLQTQLDETRRQGSATRRIAWFALAVSCGSLVVATAALALRPAPPQPASQSASQTTNAATSTPTMPKP